jgi:breast cancer 2 susceptibility protein
VGFALEYMHPKCSQTWECKSSVSCQVAVSHHRSNFRNVAELLDINPKSALQHRFHLSPQDISSSLPVPPHLRGSVDALRGLKGIGCHLATQEWVDNHWSLILWKLAGMASLDPKSEADVDRKRWSWAETMRQLQYRYASPLTFYHVNRNPTHRYEKELNRGARPALRLITAQDVSAGFHMILCVSGIVWSESGIGNDGLPLVPHPTLELTDGWYRLRTRVDEVLARAARRGVIRVGRKIAVSGASVRFRFSTVAPKKELIYVI